MNRSSCRRRAPPIARWCWSVRGLTVLGAVTIFAGTAATAAGPHAGGSPGQKINRLDFDGRGTMDFVIHRHAEIAFVFSVAAVVIWWLARRRSADAVIQRSLTVLCVLVALQGPWGSINTRRICPLSSCGCTSGWPAAPGWPPCGRPAQRVVWSRVGAGFPPIGA